MKSYQIIKYADFFKKLGYNDSEVAEEYELHKKHITDKDKAQCLNIMDKWVYKDTKINTWSIVNDAGDIVLLTDYLDLSKALGKSIETMDCPITYIKKDSSHLNAHIYCCWDLQRMTGESKIKFLNT